MAIGVEGGFNVDAKRYKIELDEVGGVYRCCTATWMVGGTCCPALSTISCPGEKTGRCRQPLSPTARRLTPAPPPAGAGDAASGAARPAALPGAARAGPGLHRRREAARERQPTGGHWGRAPGVGAGQGRLHGTPSSVPLQHTRGQPPQAVAASGAVWLCPMCTAPVGHLALAAFRISQRRRLWACPAYLASRC